MKNNPAGLSHRDTLKDCFKRADELSSPNGSQHSGMMCNNKDLRRIVLLTKIVRMYQMANISLRPAIRNFSLAMEKILKKHDPHNRGWKKCTIYWLMQRLRQETDELYEAILINPNVKTIKRECIDVANFAMMIHDNVVRELNEREEEKK